MSAESGGGGGKAWTAVLAVVVSLGILAYFGSLANQLRDWSRQIECLGQVQTLTWSCMMYAEDNDGYLPFASNWCDETLQYSGGLEPYGCSSALRRPGGYAMNDALSGTRVADIASPENTVLVFDGGEGWNISGGVELLEYRHRGKDWSKPGANIGTVDGRPRFVFPEELGEFVWEPEERP